MSGGKGPLGGEENGDRTHRGRAAATSLCGSGTTRLGAAPWPCQEAQQEPSQADASISTASRRRRNGDGGGSTHKRALPDLLVQRSWCPHHLERGGGDAHSFPFGRIRATAWWG